MTATRLSYHLDQDLLDSPPSAAHDGEECEYCEPPEPSPAELQDGNLYGSGITRNAVWGNWETHLPVIDIDFPCRWVESSTPGHGHLYIDKGLTADQYGRLLRVLNEVGLVQDGIVNQYDRLGQTFVRQPHVKKPRPADVGPRNILGERVERPNPWPWLDQEPAPERVAKPDPFDLGHLSWDVFPIADDNDPNYEPPKLGPIVPIGGLPVEPRIDFDDILTRTLSNYLPNAEDSVFAPRPFQNLSSSPLVQPKRKPLRKRLWQKVTDKVAEVRYRGCCGCEDW